MDILVLILLSCVSASAIKQIHFWRPTIIQKTFAMGSAGAATFYLPKGDPDPNGDAILAIGPEKVGKQLRVATKVLSLASPVFAVMFGPQWVEGQGLSTISPPSIRLKDDDPDAMHYMLAVLHYRRDVNQELPLPLLKELALLCDKYDCSTALSPWAQIHLRKVHSGRKLQFDVLWMSYVFGCAHTFWMVTKNILHKQVGISLPESMQTAHDRQGMGLLPDRMLESLKACQLHIHSSLQRQIEVDLFPFVHSTTEPYGHDHCQASARVGHYIGQLYQLGLWPFTSVSSRKSINTILTNIGELKPFPPPTDACDCLKKSSPADERKISDSASVFAREGLCFNCVKKGRLGAWNDNCMVAPNDGKCRHDATKT